MSSFNGYIKCNKFSCSDIKTPIPIRILFSVPDNIPLTYNNITGQFNLLSDLIRVTRLGTSTTDVIISTLVPSINQVLMAINSTTASWQSLPTTFNDNTFIIQDNTDTTKKLQFQLNNITTGTTRTLTIPDVNDTIICKTTTDTLTNKTMTGLTNILTASLLKSATTEVNISSATAPSSGQVLTATSSTAATWQSLTTFSDNTFIIQDDTDTTKKLQFQLSGITTGTTRTLTIPDVNDTIVCKTTTDTLTNKTMTGTTNTLTASLLKSATTEVNISSATAPSSGQVLTATSNTAAIWQALNYSSVGIGSASVSEIQTAGTNGGTFTSGAWQTRTLNTITSSVSWISLASNIITLTSGSYFIFGYASVSNVDANQCRLQNTTAGTTTIYGGSSTCNSNIALVDSVLGILNITGTASFVNCSHILGYFTIASSSTFQLQHRCVTTKTNTGFGLACNFGSSEVYSQLIFYKLS